jgi:hypothetical protein
MTGADKAADIGRREFLRGAVRYASLGALTSAVVLLSRTAPSPNGLCVRDYICGRCPLVPDCALPQAASFRTNNRETGP